VSVNGGDTCLDAAAAATDGHPRSAWWTSRHGGHRTVAPAQVTIDATGTASAGALVGRRPVTGALTTSSPPC
jgi:chitodextrinase